MLGAWLKSSVWMAVLTNPDDSDQQEFGKQELALPFLMIRTQDSADVLKRTYR